MPLSEYMSNKIGSVSLKAPNQIIAGRYSSFKLIYTSGFFGIDDSGSIKIACRFASDMGTPQFDRPQDPNYVSVQSSNGVELLVRYDVKNNIRPWGKTIYIKLKQGFMKLGDTLTIHFGDTSKGSAGMRMQTFCEKTFEFKTLVDPFATYQFKELIKSPTLEIISGTPVKAVCLAPSQVQINTSFIAYLRVEDRWGNAVNKAMPFQEAGFSKCEVRNIECTDPDSGLTAISNPINVFSEAPEVSRWWADFHGQTEETIGSNSIEDYFLYARDCAGLDIVAHQGNDFQITDEFWDKVNQTTEKYYVPGKFLTFPGYEWSGNTPLGGDRNIYHKEEGLPIFRSSHDLLPEEKSKYPVAPTATELYERLKPEESFAFAHVGGRYANMSMHGKEVEVAMEIHSAWGTFEWLVEDAFKNGYRIGICANSDGHKCRPGASYPGASKFGSYGGLTCVLADKLERESVFDAMKARHFYATTGNRLLLDVEIITADGGKAVMGDVVDVNNSCPELKVKITGTAPIDYVEIRNGCKIIKTVRPYNESDLGSDVKIIWSGAEVKGRARKTGWNGTLQTYDNEITSFTSVNFWNPDSQPTQINSDEIFWNSITTGGIAGLIVTLESPENGELKIRTNQIDCDVKLSTIGLEPLVYDLGGVGKKLELYRLPQQSKARCDLNLNYPLEELKNGDNPIYVKVVQQDGHIAWSSPVYLILK